MKTIYLVRHAKSSWDNPGLRDHDRPLNTRGRRDAPIMGQLLHERGVRPDALVSSSAVRALTTARHFAKALGIKKESIRVTDTIYEAMPEDILEVIQHLPEEWSTVLLFGHNPTFTIVANRFADRPIDNVPTCGIVQLVSKPGISWANFSPRVAHTQAFFYPKQFIK